MMKTVPSVCKIWSESQSQGGNKFKKIHVVLHSIVVRSLYGKAHRLQQWNGCNQIHSLCKNELNAGIHSLVSQVLVLLIFSHIFHFSLNNMYNDWKAVTLHFSLQVFVFAMSTIGAFIWAFQRNWLWVDVKQIAKPWLRIKCLTHMLIRISKYHRLCNWNLFQNPD